MGHGTIGHLTLSYLRNYINHFHIHVVITYLYSLPLMYAKYFDIIKVLVFVYILSQPVPLCVTA